MKFIGITGGVGAGKSSVLAYILENYPCEIYLADEVAH
ncbi:MAG: dephospho-CoA kinase, partial [Lachnospiraceae bacterium]|nr:dephospho-CoA kinase [Lachnospiraceae bacterium]